MSDTNTEQVGEAVTETGTTGSEAEQQARTFTQDELEKIVGQRLARQRAQFPNEDELKSLRERAGKLDEIEQQSKSELEKAQERASQLEKQMAETSARAQEALLRSSVITEAARKNVVDPDAAYALLDRAKLEFADDGAPTNIADAMDELLKAKPYLVNGGRGSADLGARKGGPAQLTRDDLKTMTPQAIVEAQNSGRLDDLLGATKR